MSQHHMEDVLSYLHRIGALDDFHLVFQQQRNGAEDQQPPPTSAKVLRQLPTIRVKPEDLVDENNRTCCICLEKNNIGDRVKRLPCAHIFHEDCILGWLRKTCTCPVCRYELETDNRQYEQSRQERMRHRKARVHSYELDRMSVIELLSLCRQAHIAVPSQPPGTEDYKEYLIKVITESEKIEIIADTPAPNVEYTLEQLRSMKVSQLRQVMEEAGVFFDPTDVVEKEDMVRIFSNSGRMLLVEPEISSKEKDKSNDNYNKSNKVAYQAPKPLEAPSMKRGENRQPSIHQSGPSRLATTATAGQPKQKSRNHILPQMRRNSSSSTAMSVSSRASTASRRNTSNRPVVTSSKHSQRQAPQRRSVFNRSVTRKNEQQQKAPSLQRNQPTRRSRVADYDEQSYGDDYPSDDDKSVSSTNSMWC
mmetsp:Transcript_26050/g.39430  ORF Transcript_26050/g.39430 Transcript_26050/m.39430 type:complete len:420 (+) Transcript_26050:154-1413(+)|eukprot:CAMPEP_0178916764 /NCGR_PEP_ID=MMETSP0786-20121207/12841_1 /TAXON_ID=186022 /ORGANISM="Thalassionema frauenfeldii, Strain CCMP 1798" /LENGTH=419 /DNA_ID=CAMNT_0020590177 /DNA_START=106 /DNA_END=1368 /DNA_ORIENTATION=-